jgi:hypothetical protein
LPPLLPSPLHSVLQQLHSLLQAQLRLLQSLPPLRLQQHSQILLQRLQLQILLPPQQHLLLSELLQNSLLV